MSSPHLNNLIIVGCMCTYLSVIFLGLDSGLSSVAAFPYGNITPTNSKMHARSNVDSCFSLHGSRLVIDGWLQSGVWCNVLEDLAGPFDIHWCQTEQKSDQGLSTVYGRRDIVGHRRGDYVDVAVCRSILSGHQTDWTNGISLILNSSTCILIALLYSSIHSTSITHRLKTYWLSRRMNTVNPTRLPFS